MNETLLRKRSLAAIHVAKQQLDMDDASYRALLERVSGEHGTACRSSADMTADQRRAVLDELRSKEARRTYPRRPHNADHKNMPEMITKIEALLTDMRLPWAYADGIAKRQWGVERMAWVRDGVRLKAIIAALHVEQKKRALAEAVDARMQALGWNEAELAKRYTLPKGWRRKPATMKALLNQMPEPEANA